MKNPDLHRAPRRIIAIDMAEDLKKHFLRHVFRFPTVPQNVRGDAIDQSSITADQQGTRIILTVTDGDD